MVTRHCGDFIMYINIKSFCCVPETNAILSVNYNSIFKKIILKE